MLLLILAALAADPPLAVKLKTPAAGDRYRCTRRITATTTNSLTVMGNPLPVPMDPHVARDKWEYTDEVVAWPAAGADGRAEVRRTYLADEAENYPLPGAGKLAGRTLRLAADGPGHAFKTAEDGAALNDEEQARAGTALDVPFKGWAFHYLPAKPLAVGDEHRMDPAVVARLLIKDDYKHDAGGSSAVCKLVSRERKDGADYGRFEMTADLVLTHALKGHTVKADEAAEPTEVEMPLKDGSKYTFKLVFEGCVDGSRYDLTATTTERVELRPDLAKLTGNNEAVPVEVQTVREREMTDRLEAVEK